MIALDVDGLAKTYQGGTEAVRDLTFQIARGELRPLRDPANAGDES